MKSLSQFAVVLLLVVASACSGGAGDRGASDQIATVDGKGMLAFNRDKVGIEGFNDPDYPGVSCWMVMIDRAWSLSDPSNSPVACRQTGPIPTSGLTDRKDVFSRSKSLMRGTTVHRFWDDKRNTLLYLVVTTGRGEKSGSGTSISTVPVMPWPDSWPPAH